MGRRAFTISLLAFLGFAILKIVSADEPSEELAAQINSNAGSLLEPSENEFRLVRSPDADSKKPPQNREKPKHGPKKPRNRKGRRPTNGKGKGGKRKGENGKNRRRPLNRKGKGKKGRRPGGIRPRNEKGGGKRENGKRGRTPGNRKGKGEDGRKEKKGRRKGGIGPRNGKVKGKGGKNWRPNKENGNVKVGRKQGCDETALCKNIKLYIKYSNQQRKAKRILRTCKTMKSKHDKAGTEFEATAAAIKDSDDTSVTAIQATLETCNTTAKAVCALSNVAQCSDEEQAKINACVTKLKAWIDAFGPGASSCLGQASCCTCINSIELVVPDDCLNYDTIDKDSLKKKNKCTKSEAGGGGTGSFGECRKKQQLAAEQGPPAFGKKCKNGAVTTAKPSGRRRKAVLKIRKELNIKK